MCHHHIEARSIEELRERHRSEEADARLDETPDADAVDDPAGESEERQPRPNRARRPTTDAAGDDSASNPDNFSRSTSR